MPSADGKDAVGSWNMPSSRTPSRVVVCTRSTSIGGSLPVGAMRGLVRLGGSGWGYCTAAGEPESCWACAEHLADFLDLLLTTHPKPLNLTTRIAGTSLQASCHVLSGKGVTVSLLG